MGANQPLDPAGPSVGVPEPSGNELSHSQAPCLCIQCLQEKPGFEPRSRPKQKSRVSTNTKSLLLSIVYFIWIYVTVSIFINWFPPFFSRALMHGSVYIC